MSRAFVNEDAAGDSPRRDYGLPPRDDDWSNLRNDFSGERHARNATRLTTTFVVREVTDEADVAQVRRLVTAHGDARSTLPGVEHIYADAAGMPGAYKPPSGGIWLAVAGESGVGCVALRSLDANVGEVKRMFVDSEWRGRGVGRALLLALIDGARARGYTTLRLGTLHDMHTAQRLYLSLGFVQIERYRPNELIDTR